jgi:GntR family transcriptional regulator, transcriptional repressor for pyruvate dehydrogenase complex
MSADQLWSPLRAGKVSDLAANRIVELIQSHELQPGSRLPSERELATRLAVSRPTLREALRSLQAHGRVEIRHGAGVFVADVAARQLRSRLAQQELELRELFDMREVLELPAAEWAARRGDPARLAEVEQAYRALAEASQAAQPDWTGLQGLDEAFHLKIVAAAGNAFLSQTVNVLHAILAQGMQTTLAIPGRLEKSRRDHERIFAAIMRGDPGAARRAAREHVRGARNAALKRVREHAGAAKA